MFQTSCIHQEDHLNMQFCMVCFSYIYVSILACGRMCSLLQSNNKVEKRGIKSHCLLQTTLTSSQRSTQACVVGNFCWLNEQKCQAFFLCASCTPTAMYVALERKREGGERKIMKESKK